MTGPQQFSFEQLFADSVPGARDGTVARRGRYDFAVAYPDPDSLPLNDLMDSLRTGLLEEGRNLAIYPHPQGYPPLREFVADRLTKEQSMHVGADDIILGDGSGQPIHMLAEALLNPGDVVLTEDFVYSGTLNTLRRFQADIRGIPCDKNGMSPDALESAIKSARLRGQTPKFIYTIPTFQNPQGWTAPLERRQDLVSLSQRYDVPILEDDCYVDLRFDGKSIPSLHSLDDTGRVMYVGSFSKIIAPGMRLGYLTAPLEILARIRAIKSGGGVNQFAALAVHRYVVTHLDSHIDLINTILRNKRDAMLAALGENLGSTATWSQPSGGLYIWVRFLNENTDMMALQERVMQADVGYQPGVIFSADQASGKNYARLCFGFNSTTEIHEGVARLADVLEKEGVIVES